MTAVVRRGGVADDMPERHQQLGPYRLVQQLGEGGMGVVHLGVDRNGRAVAIKVLRDHIAHDHDARARLAREVETLALVQDARVAAVLDADTVGPRPYIVTRYVPGPSLDRVVAEHGRLQGESLLRVGRGLSGALSAIHSAGVVHRDLKPANVLLLDGDPVVIDFGIAHVADDIRLTMTGLVMGTPGYLSPEVVEGAPVTEATDWWGWAATLAFAAAGAPPFGRGPMDVVLDRVRRGQADLSGVDPRLAPLLAAALSPDASRRPHADEVVDALDRYAAGGPATVVVPVAPATTPFPHPPTEVWADDPHPTLVDRSAEGRPAPGGGDLQDSDWQAAWDGGPGQPDPRIGRPDRTGTVFALLMALVGLIAVLPAVGAGVVVIGSWFARFADRSVTSLVTRRYEKGRRRRDVPIAVIAGPWHILSSAVATLVGLLLPLLVAVASTFSAALAIVAVTGGSPQPDTSAPLAAGGLIGLLTAWWGPGGASLRRGSRSLVRGATPGARAGQALAVALCLVGAGLGVWAWLRSGQPDWWPWTRDQLSFAVPWRLR